MIFADLWLESAIYNIEHFTGINFRKYGKFAEIMKVFVLEKFQLYGIVVHEYSHVLH